jgi:mono/diheme cytochrome c family protein
MQRRPCTIPTLAAAVVAAAVGGASVAQTDVVGKGRVLAEANCARCHAIGMDDESKHKEAPPFRSIVTLYPPQDLAEALAEGIMSGHPDMPEFVFEPAEIEALIAYLGSLQPKAQ